LKNKDLTFLTISCLKFNQKLMNKLVILNF